jgi:hypothetical protein
MVRSLLALSALLALVGFAQPADDPPGPKINPKIDFPDVKGFTRGKVQTFPKAELGYSVPYDAPGLAVTVYVYNFGLKKIPDGAKSDEVKDEMKRAVADLDRAQQAGLYKSVKEVGKEEAVALGKGKDAPAALRRQFEVERKDGVKSSAIYVVGYKDHFVKLRITHNPDDKDAADKIAALLEALGGAIK